MGQTNTSPLLLHYTSILSLIARLFDVDVLFISVRKISRCFCKSLTSEDAVSKNVKLASSSCGQYSNFITLVEK